MIQHEQKIVPCDQMGAHHEIQISQDKTNWLLYEIYTKCIDELINELLKVTQSDIQTRHMYVSLVISMFHWYFIDMYELGHRLL